MLKSDEQANSESCFNRARDNEMVFVLLSRDICAPIAIRVWVEARIASGKNKRDDHQIREALACAEIMQQQFAATISARVATSLDAGVTL